MILLVTGAYAGTQMESYAIGGAGVVTQNGGFVAGQPVGQQNSGGLVGFWVEIISIKNPSAIAPKTSSNSTPSIEVQFQGEMLSITLPTAGSLRIFDLQGRELRKHAPFTTLRIPLANLPAQSAFLVVECGSATRTFHLKPGTRP